MVGDNVINNSKITDFSKKTLIFSIVLFAISFIIGIIPMICSLIAFHLEQSSKEQKRTLSVRMRPLVVTILIIGYCALIFLMIYLFLHKPDYITA